MINEVLAKDASAGEWIKDFVHSDNPKFAGKSKEQRKKQALAAYYATQRNEETEELDESLYGDRATKVLAHSRNLYDKSRTETDPTKKSALAAHSIKAHKTFLKVRDRDIAKDPEGHARKMQSGATQDFKDQEAKRGVGHVRDHVETDGQVMDEGWDDMLADVKAKRGPQPSGGSGVKKGSRYGGSKQKDTPEQDEDNTEKKK
jgi:hypothetical protein